jgi:tRNA threonylcarbamoyladenosine modification (KEOPS) complex Cgi121 subunit
MDFLDIKTNDLIIKSASSKLNLDDLLFHIRKANDNGFVQIFDPDHVINRTHLIGAYVNSLASFNEGTNKTDGAAMEMLLFAAMTDQIDRAISIVGAKTTSDFVVFSNSTLAFNKIKPFLSVHSDFKADPSHVKKVAKALGVKTDGNDIDSFILERIALSRLGSD